MPDGLPPTRAPARFTASRQLALSVAVALAVALTAAHPAYAIDRRLKLVFKTGGYGAAAGVVVGAGTMVLGLGDYRNILMGASLGLYAGILLGAYIILTPPSSDDASAGQYDRRRPYAPRRPLGPDDWSDVPDEDMKDYLPPPPKDDEGPSGPARPSGAPDRASVWTEARVWVPIVTVVW